MARSFIFSSAATTAGPVQLTFLVAIFGILDSPNWLRIVSASPDPTPHLRLDGTLDTLTETMQVVNLTRQHEGDIFMANELLPTCNMDTCVGLSSGTAGLFVASREVEMIPGHDYSGTTSTHSGINGNAEKCQCRCLQHLNTYREDLGICVDDIHECTLSPFVSGSSSEKIPFVFLPLRGQIIHPSREINFPGVRTPVCAVTSAQYLTQKGWMELRNPLDSDVPFRLFRDEGRTFLQWLGEADLRQKMQGRLILIHMMCRDMANTTPGYLGGVGAKNLFTPCVAFRVNGSPIRYLSNVPEVLFQSENSNLSSAPPEGFHTKEYIVIGICSLILGLIYVASVFLYLHVKKRKAHAQAEIDGKPGPDSKNPKNDQITFGAPFSRTESFYSGITDARNSQRSNHSNIMGGGGGTGMNADDMGLIKNNPLLRHFTGLNDNSGFVSDRSNSNSECDDSNMSDRAKNMHTSAIVHPTNVATGNGFDKGNPADSSSGNQDNECLPEANVSITEDTSPEDKLDSMKAIVNGTVRKKLYFNPAYFEPHLLMSPPPAAIEFLTKIREVIAIAKYKMATKRYQPSLNIIPEEHPGNHSEIATKAHTPQTGAMSAKTEQSNRLLCSGCPGCNTDATASKCDNCGDKHQSIQKWLEGVPFNQCQQSNDHKVTSIKTERIDKIEEVSEKEETDSVTPRRKIPPPLPLTAPKIISHSLKPNVVTIPATTVDPPIYVKTTNMRGSHPSSPSSPTKRSDGDLYGFKKTGGNEIYNNPKFLESPQLSVRSKTSSSRRSRSSTKRVEVMDQYSNPGKEREAHYEMLKSIQNMPDMVYEALAKDYSKLNFSSGEKTSTQLYNIPTPDYDGTYSKKVKDIYNNSTGSGPFVPTPDYSTMSKRSLRQYQPDSPIYRRKSPQYLIVDYETDSLERGSSLKKDCDTSSPSSNNSSDISSQPSPSLSTALPLEEEVEVHHTVYDKVEGFRKDGDNMKRIIADYESRHRDDVSPKIKYDTFRGSMTIEVAHDPHSDEVSTDSDQFEPDTLDRKPKKQNTGSFRSLNAWTEYLNKSQSFVNSTDKVSYSSLENMTSLPEFTIKAGTTEPFILRSSSSFRSESGQIWDTGKLRSSHDQRQPSQNFGSLREIYQSKVQQQSSRPTVAGLEFTEQTTGRLLTLDAKHSKRQRQVVNDKIKKLIPPDVIPADKNMYYDIPRNSENVDGLIMRKNLEGWNTSDSSGDTNTSNGTNREDTPSSSQDDTDNTTSDQSESTEITGVSDTQLTSDRANMSRKTKVSNSSFHDNDRILQIDYSAIYNKQKQENAVDSPNGKNSFISVKIGNDNSYQTYHFNSIASNIYSLPDTIVQSDQLLTSDDHRDSNSQSTASPINDLELPSIHAMNIQRVYRVEVPPPSNGMQIAMGLRDRAKKSKDLKNAWKKFVSMATGKFNGTNDPADRSDDCKYPNDSYDNKSESLEYIDRDRDEGISSLVHEDNSHMCGGIRRSRTSGGSLDNLRKTYYQSKSSINRSHSTVHDTHRITIAGTGVSVGPYRQDMDSGYISGDECKPYTQRIYERYHVGSAEPANNSNGVNIINTNPETGEQGTRQMSGRRRPQTPKTTKHSNQRQHMPATIVKSSDHNIQVNLKHPVPMSVYSSDDEPYIIPTSSSDSDDGGNTEDMCESGAESVETHSVLFKNIRYRER